MKIKATTQTTRLQIASEHIRIARTYIHGSCGVCSDPMLDQFAVRRTTPVQADTDTQDVGQQHRVRVIGLTAAG